ncbi:MAG TPA: carboxymuconolactone decarboxylase family protein [Frankiaceae bacterium]|nr:carboxymuconolactone decarboxylase family protein [Frankiaceae bacterium]
MAFIGPGARAGARPRVEAGSREQIGLFDFGLAWAAGRAVGTEPLRLFRTLAIHRRLFRGWLRFAGSLTLRGLLSRQDAELVILRVGERCRCDYELGHHRRIAALSGLTADQIAAVSGSVDAAVWTSRQRALLRAVDELHDDRDLSDLVWEELSHHLSARQVIELCMLAGHYEMLAMTLNALRVPPEPVTGRLRIAPVLRRRARSGR